MEKVLYSHHHEGGKPELALVINGKRHEWREQYITGAQVRKLGEIPEEDEIFLAVKKPWEDEVIKNDTKVDLARPGIEHFYSKKHDVHIYVNAEIKPWKEKEISFVEVVVLAFGSYNENPNVVYTVKYSHGPKENPEGIMVNGVKVYVKNDMLFVAKMSDKS